VQFQQILKKALERTDVVSDENNLLSPPVG